MRETHFNAAPRMEGLPTQTSCAERGALGRPDNPLREGEKKQSADRSPDKETAKKPDQKELLRLVENKLKELEDHTVREKEIADVGLPVHPLIPLRVRLSRESLKTVTMLQELVTQELLDRDASTGLHSSNKSSSRESVANRFKELDLTGKLRSLVLQSWDTLEYCRVSEELLAERDLPATALIPARIGLTRTMIAILAEERSIVMFIAQNARTENHANTSAEGLSRTKILQALWLHNWEALMRLHPREEVLDGNPFALLTLVPSRVQLSGTLHEIANALDAECSD